MNTDEFVRLAMSLPESDQQLILAYLKASAENQQQVPDSPE